MKSSAIAIGASLLMTTVAFAASGQAADDLKPYPIAEEGQVQHVIRLPELEDEALAKVEVIVGKTMTIDCNNHFFGGQIEKRTAEGWGYSYYVLESLGEAASTMMGCPEGSEKEAFVRSNSETLVRYNSKLPLVIYTADDVELQYRVWQAGPIETVTASE